MSWGFFGMDQFASESPLEAQWQRVRSRLKQQIGETDFRNWFSAMILDGAQGGTVRVELPSRFMRDMVHTQYRELLRMIWSDENPEIKAVEVAVARKPRLGPEAIAESVSLPIKTEPRPLPLRRAETGPLIVATVIEEDFGAPLDPRLTFDNFVVDRSNELACAAARRAADANGQGYNPLVLWGGVGLGKTHLLQAIAAEIRQRTPERRVMYLSAEKFMVQFVQAVRARDTVAFKQAFRSVDVLMIDDLQFISGRDVTQEEFLHTFDALVDQQRQVVLSADRPPSEFTAFGDRLRARLGSGLVVQMQPTTLELRRTILDTKTASMGVTIPAPVLDFLAHKISSNIRELEGALNRVVADSTLCGRTVTLESCQSLLQDLLRGGADKRVTIDDIQRKVAEHYGIRLSDMTSARRARAVARPRQVAMYLAKQLTPRSLPEIGKKFGGRDHTTVMHAVRRIEELKAADPAMADDVELLRRLIES
jgi:chromosomal replication initiator protein